MKTLLPWVSLGILALAPASARAQSLSTVQFVSAAYSVHENAAYVQLAVERIGDPGRTAYVEYASQSGSATFGEDYIEQTGFLSFDGETNLTIVIPILNDAAAERDETFSVSLFNPDPVDSQLGTVTTAVVTLFDNDAGLQFSAADYAVNETAGLAIITVRLETDNTNTVSVDCATSNLTATAGLDHLSRSGTLTFAPGETNQSFAVPILNDGLTEGHETIQLTLSNPTGGAPLGPASSAVLTILDNDPGVEFSSAFYTVDETAGAAVIRVTRGSDSTNEFSVDFVADGCSATTGADYGAQSGRLSFARGETEKTILIPILDDALTEGEETVNLTLTGPAGVAFGRHRSAVLVIRDDEEEATNGHNLAPRRKGLWSTASGSPVDVEVAGHFAYLRMFDGALQVLDISDPSSPQRVGSYPGGVGGDFDLAVSGNFVYMADASAGLQVIDVSNPANPQWVGGYDTGVDALGVAVSGNFAYVADWMDGFQVIDISNPANPERVGLYLTDRYFGSVSLSGNFAYLGLDLWDGQQHHGSLGVIDISDPTNPQPVGSISTGAIPETVAISGGYAYVGLYSGGLEIIDIRDPANPQRVGGYEDQSYAWHVAVSGQYAYVAGWPKTLVVIDISNPANPQPVGTYDMGSSSDVAVSGNYAFVTGGWGLEVLDISAPTNAFRTGGFETLNYPAGVAVSDNYAFVSDNYAWLRIFDISDRANPRPAGRAATREGTVGVVVACDLAFVVEGSGLEVFDISQPAHPRSVGAYNADGATVAVAVQGNRAYLVSLHRCPSDCAQGGLDVIDISDPANLRRLGSVAIANVALTYGIMGPTAVSISGHYAYVPSFSHVAIIDVSDPFEPRTVGTIPWNFSRHAAISGHFAYVTDSSGALGIFEVTDPGSPQPVGAYTTRVDFVRELKVVGGYAYVTGSAGLEIIDVRDPAHPRQAARYGTAGGPLAVLGEEAFLVTPTGLEILDLDPLGFLPGSTRRLANGQVTFTLNARFGAAYTLETSSNLVDWLPLATLIASDNKLTFTDPNAASFSHRFYRASIVSQ